MDPRLSFRGLNLTRNYLSGCAYKVSSTEPHANFDGRIRSTTTPTIGNLDRIINTKRDELSAFLHNLQPDPLFRPQISPVFDEEDWTTSFESVYTGMPGRWTFSALLNVFLFYYAILSIDGHNFNPSNCPLSQEEFQLWLQLLPGDSERLLLHDLLQLLWPAWKVCLVSPRGVAPRLSSDPGHALNATTDSPRPPLDRNMLFKGKIMGSFQQMLLSMQTQILTLCTIFPVSQKCSSNPRVHVASVEDLFAPLLRRTDFEEFQILCEIIIEQAKNGFVRHPEHSLYALTYFLCLDEHLYTKREIFRQAVLDVCHKPQRTTTPEPVPSPQSLPPVRPPLEQRNSLTKPPPPLFNEVPNAYSSFGSTSMSRQQSLISSHAGSRRSSLASISDFSSTPASNAVWTPATSFHGTSPPSWSNENLLGTDETPIDYILNFDTRGLDYGMGMDMASPYPHDNSSFTASDAALKKRYWNKVEKRCVHRGCQKRCSTSSNWWRHFRGSHKDASMGSGAGDETWCHICKMPLARKDAMTPHIKSKRHKDAVRAFNLQGPC